MHRGHKWKLQSAGPPQDVATCETCGTRRVRTTRSTERGQRTRREVSYDWVQGEERVFERDEPPCPPQKLPRLLTRR
jgi:hypothetical protein